MSTKCSHTMSLKDLIIFEIAARYIDNSIAARAKEIKVVINESPRFTYKIY